LTLFLLIFGCAETEIGVISPPPSLSFEELKQRVSRIRGLPFRSDVSLETKGTEEMRQLLEKSIAEEYGKENLALITQVYRRLGLLSEATELQKALVDLNLVDQAFYYESHRKKIILPDQPLKSGLPTLRLPWTTEDATQQLRLTRALAHLLQQQHFQLPEKLKSRNTNDSELALGALIKGDTALVTLAHLLGDPKENRQKMLDGVKDLARLPPQIDKELSHLPELLRQKVAFQYVYGSQFAMWAFSMKGWEGVNGLFKNPPLTTQQILHPEKYYIKRKEAIRITPWGLFDRFRGKKIMDDTLGEFLIQFLLSRFLSKEEAQQTAAGWAGDSFVAFQEGTEMVLGWVTAWDNQGYALEFYRSFRRALERRYGITLEPTVRSVDTLTAPSQSGHSLLLQINGNLVFFLDGVPPPRSVEIAEYLWKHLETGSEPEPLELAGEKGQWLPIIK
jgi:hypothetical protein